MNFAKLTHELFNTDTGHNCKNDLKIDQSQGWTLWQVRKIRQISSTCLLQRISENLNCFQFSPSTRFQHKCFTIKFQAGLEDVQRLLITWEVTTNWFVSCYSVSLKTNVSGLQVLQESLHHLLGKEFKSHFKGWWCENFKTTESTLPIFTSCRCRRRNTYRFVTIKICTELLRETMAAIVSNLIEISPTECLLTHELTRISCSTECFTFWKLRMRLIFYS